MNTRKLAKSSPTAQQPGHRHICGWCRRDLGALWQGSQHHSYAICETCKQVYFAYLYEPAARAQLESERARA